MSNYVLVFRGKSDRTPDAEQEAAWGQWLGEISASIVDAGNRIGRATALGDSTPNTVVSGYILIKADDHEAAIAVAKGCPGLKYGGGIEIGETISSA
jgi:hypothetical protein